MEEDFVSNTNAKVIPVTLHCSDGVDRSSYALNTSPIYLSEGAEGSQTANGVCSSESNLTLCGQVGLLEGNSIGTVLDELIRRQAEAAGEDSTFMVSNTLQAAPDLFLTNTLYTEDGQHIETFYVLDVLDKETVQLYTLSRTYQDSNLTEQQMQEMNIDELLKYCLSSDDNRQVYCGILQSLLQHIQAE